LRACPRFPSAKLRLRKKKLPAGPARPAIDPLPPIFILALVTIQTGVCESARKARNGWIVLGIRLFHSNPPKLPTRAADSWIYHAKDSATGAAVALHLTREACTDATNDTLTTTPPLGGKYSFRASVDHAQIGSMAGCARIAAELFPKINNQPDQEEEEAKKKPPAPTITISRLPLPLPTRILSAALFSAVARQRRLWRPKAPKLALSHDGKKLLYTRSDSKTSPDRTIVLYDLDSGKSLDLLHGLVRQAFWSPDDGRIVFLKALDSSWQVWSFPAGHPESALAFSHRSQLMLCTDGWIITPSWRQTC